MNHHRVTREGQETAALYALGALSQLEASSFDIHLGQGCPACDAELKEFGQVVGALGSVAAPVAPPTYVRDLLIARIEREPLEAASEAATVIPFPEQTGGTELRSAPPRSPGYVWLPWAIAAAFLIAFVYAFTLQQTERRSSQEARNYREAATVAREENAELKNQLSKESAKSTELTEINSVLSAPEWRIIPLGGQEPAPGAAAKIYWDVQGKRWVVSADLPPPPEGKVYQLWFVTPNAKISGGLINLRDDGHGLTVVPVPPSINKVAAAAISIEPEGGSAQPTLVYLIGNA